jgi:hypothetical protein
LFFTVKVILLIDNTTPVVPRLRPQILVRLAHLMNESQFDSIEQFLTGKSVPGPEPE